MQQPAAGGHPVGEAGEPGAGAGLRAADPVVGDGDPQGVLAGVDPDDDTVGAGVLHGVRERLAGDEPGRGLHLLGERARGFAVDDHPDLDGRRQLADQRPQRLDEAAVERRRAQPLGDPAQLGDRGRDLRDRLVEQAVQVGRRRRLAEVALVADAITPSRAALASYGPFHLVSADTVEMIGTVDSATPRQFAALLAAHPAVRRLVMVDCPGSVDEAANHVLARAVRRAGLETMVPDGGSVRSGAVDLFLAGVRRRAALSAEFGVHSWRDEDGYEARDFPADDPVHAEYLGYYREMGMDDAAARRFYALTNSVGFDDVRYLGARDMARLGLAEITG